MMSQKYIYPSLFQEEEPQESVPGDKKEYDLTNLFERLAKSDFRSRFHLSKQDREYVRYSARYFASAEVVSGKIIAISSPP